MNLITRQTLAATAAHRWAMQYRDCRPGDYRWEIGRRLRALGPTPSPDAVDSTIGNSWTTVPACDECGRCPPAVVEVGEPPDYESSTAKLCADCLRKALGMIEGSLGAAAPSV